MRKGGAPEVFSTHLKGVDFFMDPSVLGADAVPRVRDLLRRALSALGEGAKGEEAAS